MKLFVRILLILLPVNGISQNDSVKVSETFFLMISEGRVDERYSIVDIDDTTILTLDILENQIIVTIKNYGPDSLFSKTTCHHMQYYFQAMTNDTIVFLGNNNYCDYGGTWNPVAIGPMEAIKTHSCTSENLKIESIEKIRVQFYLNGRAYYSKWYVV
ncbi:hypothetical protein K6119_10690 [Paracrocinitomix mangrovi]|uniref:hypothetical protein n=1 Tax=Paracrocinitomix mangrovi TaxID=2862509 RepID=UPI001C8E3C12|nr:hypothetical protein [Paracrocinitomix mangrovi]UKN00199.1 hypothetical protein K6119_10690 [Paracrocinitomix mangrovi]